MKSIFLYRQLLLVGLFYLPCAAGIKGEKKMESEYWQAKQVEVGYNERVVTMFPVGKINSWGLIAGNSDKETLRILTLAQKHLSTTTFNNANLQPVDELGYCLDGCAEMYLHQRKILSIVNWKENKIVVNYRPRGDMVENEFLNTKIIDDKNKIVLTAFSPIYDENYKNIINNTYLFTLEDLTNKKRIKILPINTESGFYKTDKRGDFRMPPNVSFGPDFTIYRESEKYKWLCINNALEYIDHPLKDTLNAYNDYFTTRLISLEISPTQPYAIAICEKAEGKNFPAIIQWNKAPAIMPVAIPLEKEQRVEYSSLQLSPSGRWAYFYITGYPGARHYLLYIDTSLPGGCLPPFDLQVKIGEDDDFAKATWMTSPEGLVMKVGGKLMYWDLSKFNANDFLKTQENDFLHKEKARQP
jgi:hypothetical protein